MALEVDKIDIDRIQWLLLFYLYYNKKSPSAPFR